MTERLGITDLERALFWAKEIRDPCTAVLKDGAEASMRGTYVRAARRELSLMTDPGARELLEVMINEYGEEH